jgi:pyruvate kinase
MRRTKIVATIGPASREPETLKRMVEAGLDVARLNFSHGDREIHAENAERVRAAANAAGRQVAILQDLPGPKLRIGALEDGIAELKPGETLMLKCGSDEVGNGRSMSVTWGGLAGAVDPDDVVYLADGAIRLRVTDVSQNNGEIVTAVEVGGSVASRQGLNIPGSTRGLPAVPEEDFEMLRFGESINVDLVALSFVRTAEDVTSVRKHTRLPLIAKIEKPQAVDSAEEIIRAADCVMVARGDLGIELPIEDVPIVQKQLLRVAGRLARPSITATQMLDSMVNSSRPTRAEVADVANAILDGTDAVMLSQETAVGQYPCEAVEMIAVPHLERGARPARRARPGVHGRLQRLRGRTRPSPCGSGRSDAVGPLGQADLGAPAAGADLRAVAGQGDRPALQPDVGRAGGLDPPPRDHRGADRRRRAACGGARLGQARSAHRDHRRAAQRRAGHDEPGPDPASLTYRLRNCERHIRMHCT